MVRSARRRRRRRTGLLVVLGLILLAAGVAGLYVATDPGADESADGSATDASSATANPRGGEDEPTDSDTDGTDANGNDTADGDDTVSATDGEDETVAGGTEAESSTGTPGLDNGPTAPPEEGPWVRATLDLDVGAAPGLFVLEGRVPSEELEQQLQAAAEVAYAPFVQADLEVDPTLPASPAIATSPAMIGLLPSLSDGTILVTPDSVAVTGRTPNQVDVERLSGALTAISGGLPVDAGSVEVNGKALAQFSAVADGEELVLDGVLPSEDVRDLILGGAAAAYGPDGFTSTIEVDDDVTTSFWMLTMPGVLGLLSQFDHYQFEVVEGVTSGSLQGGVSFAVDSTEISPEAAELLNIGVAILARDPSLAMGVVGHTDSTGPDDLNQALSLARAESVVAYFEAAGIDRERLTARGAGETDPISPNSTPEGRALNRRVEFEFGPPTG